MTTTDNKAVVVRFNKEFIERGNLNVLTEIVADNFVNHTAAASVSDGVDGLKEYVKMLDEGFSDFQVAIHEQLAEGDMVASRKTISATHTGEIMGHEATGKRIEFKVMDFVRLRDGKYVEHWGQNNIREVIQQLGE